MALVAKDACETMSPHMPADAERFDAGGCEKREPGAAAVKTEPPERRRFAKRA